MALLCAGGFGAAAWQTQSLSGADKLTEAERLRMIAEPCMVRDTQTLEDWPETKCTTEGRSPITVWGDSFAAHYFDALRKLAARNGRSLTLLAESSCPPIAGLAVPNRTGCEPFNRAVIAKLTTERPEVVILSADWVVYEKKKTLAEAFVDKFALLKATITQLKNVGSRVIVIGPSPGFTAPVPRIADGNPLSKAKGNYSRKFDRFFRDLAASGTIAYFPAYASFCDESMFCTFRDANGLLFWDEGHLTDAGADMVMRKLVEQIPELERH
jgi:hypothetical protein